MGWSRGRDGAPKGGAERRSWPALRPPRLLLLHGPEEEEGQEGLLALPAEEGGG